MSNMDWLQTLLGGVSGAFTGASVANDRRSREAELARQAARQMMLDERQAKLDTESAFDRGIQRESALGELGYERGTIPRTGPAMMQLPGMGAMDVGAVMDARIGPQMTTPDGGQFTLNRFQTPTARNQSAMTAKREEARAEIERRAREREDDRNFTANENRLNRESAERRVSIPRPGSGTPQPLRAPTEAQEKSAMFYGLMTKGVEDMQRIGFVTDPLTQMRKPNPRIRPLAIQAALTVPGANYLLNEDEQQYMKAARDFAAGVLRKESGAALRDEEVRQTMQRYIDMPGDADSIRNTKAKSREQYMGLMERSALPALRYYDSVRQNGAPVETRPDPDFGGLPNRPEDYN